MDTARKTVHHVGTEARGIASLVGMVLVICCFATAMQNAEKVTNADGQSQSAKSIDAKAPVVPITQEEHHHLVLENEYVRVFHVEVAPHSETFYHQHDMDYVFVTLGDSVVESVRVGEKPVKLELKDGDTRFTKGGFAHKAVNLSDKPFVNVTVELKRAVGKQLTVLDDGGLNCDDRGFCKKELLQYEHLKARLTWGNHLFGMFRGDKELIVAVTPVRPHQAQPYCSPSLRMEPGDIATTLPNRVASCPIEEAKFVVLDFD